MGIGPPRPPHHPPGRPLSAGLPSPAMLCAFVLVDAEPGRVAALASELADVRGVAEVYSVTGRADLVAIVRVKEHDELADIVTGRIAGLPGILGTETMVAFQAFSRHDLEAMWSVGLE